MNEITISIGFLWFLVILAGFGSFMLGWYFFDLVKWMVGGFSYKSTEGRENEKTN